MITYQIKIQYYPVEKNIEEVIEITTDRLDWSIDQYRRNRKPFKLISVNKK